MSPSKFWTTIFLILARLNIFASFLQFFHIKKTRKKTNLFFIITFDKIQLSSIDFLQTLAKKSHHSKWKVLAYVEKEASKSYMYFWALSFRLTLFWMGEEGQKKTPPNSFSPVTSSSVGINPQHFLTFSFNPFATLA